MSNKGKKNRGIYFSLLALMIVLLVIVIDAGMILMKDRESSETENRILAQKPEVSVSRMLSGAFEQDFEDYVADQFPLRDKWIFLESTVSRMLGKTESGDIFLGKSGYLIQRFHAPSEKSNQETLDAIEKIVSANPKVKSSALIVPTAVSTLSDKLPAFAVTDNQNRYLNDLQLCLEAMNIQWVDVRDTLKNGSTAKQMYYKTDHHWTTDAAFMAYKTYADETGLKKVENYKALLASDSFKGTLTASSGMRVSETDEVHVYEPEDPVDYTVTYVDENTSSASVYVTECLQQRDHYSMFFGGNHAQVEIETASKNEETLLVFKDSYANCFVPFLIPHYARIIMIDPRYYTGDIEELIKFERVNKILFLYNANTLAEDTGLAQMMQ